MRRVLKWWLLSRLGYLIISVVVLYLPWVYAPGHLGVPLVFTEWMREDAWAYRWIAVHGYTTAYWANWPPLYPLLIHLLLWLPGGPLLLGLAVSSLASLAGCVGLVRLQSTHLTDRQAQTAVGVLLASPFAFFLAAPWSMSLLVCLSIWCFVCIERRIWSLAALCVFLAVLTSDVGVCLAIPLVYAWVHQLPEMSKSDTSVRRMLVEPSVVFLGAPVGLLVWCLYQAMQFHGQVASFHDQTVYFDHHFVWPGLGLWLIAGNVVSVTLHHRSDLLRMLMDVLPFAGVLTLAVYATIRRLWPTYHAAHVFALLTLIAVLPVQGQQFPDVILSAGRYLLAVIPIWLVLPRLFLHHRRLGIALLVVSCVLQIILTIAYLLGGWIV